MTFTNSSNYCIFVEELRLKVKTAIGSSKKPLSSVDDNQKHSNKLSNFVFLTKRDVDMPSKIIVLKTV